MFNLPKVLRKTDLCKPTQSIDNTIVRPFNEDRILTTREENRKFNRIMRNYYCMMENYKHNRRLL